MGLRVALMKGNGFYLHLAVLGGPKNFKEVTVLTYHLKNSRETKFVYFLDEDYDLVEGKWSIENFFGEKRFYQTYIITYQSVPDETLLVLH